MNRITKIAGLIIGSLLLVLLVVITKTILNKPVLENQNVSLTALPTDAIKHMTEAIQIATETPNDAFEYDSAVFYSYRKLIEKNYPLVHQQLSRTVIDSFNYIYKWQGTDTTKLPMVLMAHYDVVPVEASAIKLWHAKPYGGEVKDNYIWGRGVLDDKSSMISLLEATEAQLKAGFIPSQTIYLCFGADEESNGRGAAAMVKYFESKKQRFDMVVDEGGEISTEDNKNIRQPIASVGVGEKGYVTLVLSVQRAGGHSSIPEKSSSIGILSKALHTIEENQIPTRITPPIKAYLERISSYNTNFFEKMQLSNLWLFEKWVLHNMTQNRSSNALVRTTLVPTVVNSGVRDNVIPTFATAMVNSRILPGETPNTVKAYVEKIVNDTNVKISIYPNYETMPSTTTEINSAAFKRVESAIHAVVKDVVVAPMLMVGATDSRNYRTLSDGVINFTPLTDAKGYHGIDERMLISDYEKCFNYYTFLIKGSK
jgi:carboxypeptidase PM20D1